MKVLDRLPGSEGQGPYHPNGGAIKKKKCAENYSQEAGAELSYNDCCCAVKKRGGIVGWCLSLVRTLSMAEITPYFVKFFHKLFDF